MKVVTYKYEQMAEMAAILNQIQFSGIDSARAVTEIANILDAGTVTDAEENTDPDGEDGPEDAETKGDAKTHMAAETDAGEHMEKEQQGDA